VRQARPPEAAGTARPVRVITAVAVLLTFASGASDVAGFTRLGNVFTSVMTGNIALFGLSLARESVSLAAHTGTAVASYIAGVAVGTAISQHRGERADGTAAVPPGAPDAGEPTRGEPAGGHWPRRTTPMLAAELLLFAGVLAGWEATGARPAHAGQYVILALAACGMGIQSAAVNRMGLRHMSTTYLTGTLTGLVSAIVRRDGAVGSRRPAVLGGLVAGAVLAGVLLATAAWAVPLLPTLAVAAAMLLGSVRRIPRRPRPRPAPAASRDRSERGPSRQASE
jgi:uncharacterized membrane protein YoaK (UPF0700 family)